MDRFRRAQPSALMAGVLATVVGLLVAMLATGFSMGAAVPASVHPVAMAVLLGLVSIPLIRWVSRGDVMLMRLLTGGLFAKGLGTYLRFALTGDGDNLAYDEVGTRIAGLLSEAIVYPGDLPGRLAETGTGRVSYAVGWLYFVTGSNRLTAFVVFSFLSFFGMLFFFRAAVSAIPELDRHRYALLLFYLPSMLFWPSTIGKEAWMIGFLGLASLGVSGLVRHQLSPKYILAVSVGLMMAAQVRPHMAALAIVGLLAAIMWPSGGRGKRGIQLVTVAVGFVLLSLAMVQVADFFGSERLEVNPILEFAQARTADGGSEFSPTRINGLVSLVPGALSVLFRPFIFEASNTFQLLGSLESIAVIGLALVSFRRLRRVPGMFLTNGYVRFAVVYGLGFVIAFSVISNFGILTRQRAQLWPFLLILLALSPADDESDADASTAADEQSLGFVHRIND